MLSILAGMMIAIGGIIYLTLSGIEGALLFSMGLLTILCLKLELFTGKAGLLATREIKPGKLFEIWIGNFLGTWIISFLFRKVNMEQAIVHTFRGERTNLTDILCNNTVGKRFYFFRRGGDQLSVIG